MTWTLKEASSKYCGRSGRKSEIPSVSGHYVRERETEKVKKDSQYVRRDGPVVPTLIQITLGMIQAAVQSCLHRTPILNHGFFFFF